MSDTKSGKRISVPLIILSLALLVNTPFSIIDPLPDFIAYIILFRQLKSSAERAPYFAEARGAFGKLALTSALKFVALLIVASSSTSYTYGYDMYAVASWSFGAFEIIFSVSAVKNLFEALFRLGERTDAGALIRDIDVAAGSKMSVDTFKLLTFVFAVARPLLAAVPDLFRLTELTDGGSIRAVSPYYGYVLSACQIIGAAIGVFWLVVAIKYVIAVKKEGQYQNALVMVAGEGYVERLQREEHIGALKGVFTLLCVATIFSVDIKFDNTDNVNILPHTVFAILLIVLGLKLGKYTDRAHALSVVAPASLFAVCSVFYYVFETKFLYYHGYDSLFGVEQIPAEYITVEVLSVAETVLASVTLAALAVAIHAFIFKHTGIERDNPNYSPTDKKYHRSLLLQNYALMFLGILSLAAKTVLTFSKASQELARFEINLTTYVSILPSIEWLALVSAVCTIAYVGFAFYFTSTMKEEIEMKYKTEP